MSFFSRKPNKKTTRLFFATDLHGSERTFRKFINAGKFYNVNVIVMGGDIQGKLMIPIIKESNGPHRATVQGRVEHLSTEEELKSLMGRFTIATNYIKLNVENRFNATEQATEQLNQQLDVMRAKVESADEALRSFVKNTGSFSLMTKRRMCRIPAPG